MFGKLFGKSQPVPQAAPKIDPQETIAALNKQCDVINKRIKVLEAKSDDLKQTAIAKKKANDIRGATLAMKQYKMNISELAKLDGQQIILEQSKMQIESANFDVGVVTAMRTGKDAIKAANKQMDIEDIAELKEEMDDIMAENAERQNFFADVAKDGQEDLLAELDKWEAEAAKKEMQMDFKPLPVISNKPGPNKIQAKQVEEEEDEEAELAKMMMA